VAQKSQHANMQLVEKAILVECRSQETTGGQRLAGCFVYGSWIDYTPTCEETRTMMILIVQSYIIHYLQRATKGYQNH
jgi:hypothetical protein